MEIVVNASYRNILGWKDSEKRAEHVLDCMKLRGIGDREIKQAIQMGAKQIRDDNSIIAEYRWYKVIYREYVLEKVRKIYPITVIQL